MEWISVKDRLPEPFTSILLFYCGIVHEGFMVDSGCFFPYTQYANCASGVTHWMPLPDPPK